MHCLKTEKNGSGSTSGLIALRKIKVIALFAFGLFHKGSQPAVRNHFPLAAAPAPVRDFPGLHLKVKIVREIKADLAAANTAGGASLAPAVLVDIRASAIAETDGDGIISALIIVPDRCQLHIQVQKAEMVFARQLLRNGVIPAAQKEPVVPEQLNRLFIHVDPAFGILNPQLADCRQQIKEIRRLEVKRLPAQLDYSAVTGLRLEAIEKLNRIRPETVGQASRISGVSPADISVLLIYLNQRNKEPS